MLTYQDLLTELQKLTPEQLQQGAMAVLHTGDYTRPQECLPLYAVGLVYSLYHTDGESEPECQVLSAVDHKHHPEQVILGVDSHPFGEEGDLFYTLNDDLTMTGNVSGKDFEQLQRKEGEPDLRTCCMPAFSQTLVGGTTEDLLRSLAVFAGPASPGEAEYPHDGDSIIRLQAELYRRQYRVPEKARQIILGRKEKGNA